MKNLKLFTVILFFLSISKVKAQYVFVPDQNGKPLTDARYENITGTPYLVDEWTNAEVKLADNTIIKPDAVKYDMVSDKLLFKQENKIYEFYPKVAGFSLYTNNGTRTFLLKDNTKGGEGYFEVLNNGKIKLMKKVKKVILETKGYNSANLEKTVDENKKYFINLNGSEKEVKLTKKSFMEALPQFKSQIENYKLKSSNEEAFIALLETLN